MAWQFLGDNTLYWQPDTRISTFKPGLVLVQRSAVCRNDYLTTARSQIAVDQPLPCNSPSTVTVFQFPQSQEIHEGNGFVRFDVSGYGYYPAGAITLRTFVERQMTDISSGTGVDIVVLRPVISRNFITAFSETFAPINAVPTVIPGFLSLVGGGSVTLRVPYGESQPRWRLIDGGIVGVYGRYMEVNVDYELALPSNTINYSET
jgi:hypothetical protein